MATRGPVRIEVAESVGAVMLTISIAMLLWLVTPMLVEVMLYIMGAVAMYYLWVTYVRPGIQVMKFRKQLEHR